MGEKRYGESPHLHQRIPEFIGGNDKIVEFLVADEQGDVLDLTAATPITFGLSEINDVTTLFTVTGTIVAATDGHIRITIPDTDTDSLGDPEGREYHWEVKITESGGNEFDAAAGTVTIKKKRV